MKQNPKSLLVSVEGENLLHSINHRNSFKTIQRIIGYVLRFTKNTQTTKADRQNGPTLTSLELHMRWPSLSELPSSQTSRKIFSNCKGKKNSKHQVKLKA